MPSLCHWKNWKMTTNNNEVWIKQKENKKHTWNEVEMKAKPPLPPPKHTPLLLLLFSSSSSQLANNFKWAMNSNFNYFRRHIRVNINVGLRRNRKDQTKFKKSFFFPFLSHQLGTAWAKGYGRGMGTTSPVRKFVPPFPINFFFPVSGTVPFSINPGSHRVRPKSVPAYPFHTRYGY